MIFVTPLGIAAFNLHEPDAIERIYEATGAARVTPMGSLPPPKWTPPTDSGAPATVGRVT